MKIPKRHVDSLHDKHNGEPKVNSVIKKEEKSKHKNGDILDLYDDGDMYIYTDGVWKPIELDNMGQVLIHDNKSKHQERKETPVYSGVMMYFKNALKEVSKTSLAGNRQHHADKPLHWDMSKSRDELDALTRHLMDAGTVDDDGQLHSAKVAWRALAFLERELQYREDNNIPNNKNINFQKAIEHDRYRSDIEVYE